MYSAAVTSSLLRATSNSLRYSNARLWLADDDTHLSLVLRSSAAMATMKPIAASEALQGQEFWAKNKRLERPMSPHLTIYKPQVEKYWPLIGQKIVWWTLIGQ